MKSNNAVIVCAVALLFFLSLSVTAAPGWLTASEISNAVSLPDGSHVYLHLEQIVKIKQDYIVIAEPFSRNDRLIVLTSPNEALRLGQSVMFQVTL